jgi:hypothetical protein
VSGIYWSSQDPVSSLQALALIGPSCPLWPSYPPPPPPWLAPRDPQGGENTLTRRC